MTDRQTKAVAEKLCPFYGWIDPHAEYDGQPAYMNCWYEAQEAIEASDAKYVPGLVVAVRMFLEGHEGAKRYGEKVLAGIPDEYKNTR